MVKVRGLVLLCAILFVCLVFLTLQSRGRSSSAGDLVAVVTTPVQTALARINRAAFGLWATYLDWKNVRVENVKLRTEIQQLRVDGLVVPETLEENRRLRRLLDLRERLPLDTLPGEVIAREWGGWVRSLTVNRGREDKILRMTAVISPDGLIGRVVDVRPSAAIVQVLTDPASTVGGHVVRTRTPGIVEGEPRGTVRFKYMARDGSAIRVGDLIVTSGQGGVFPRGIPIGRVRAIEDRGSALFHYAALSPVVDFARIDEVLLLKGETTQDLAAHFGTDG
jgi:rod shape-determining protein MreC